MAAVFSEDDLARILTVARYATSGASLLTRLETITDGILELVPHTSALGVLLAPSDSKTAPRGFLKNLGQKLLSDYDGYYQRLDPTLPHLAKNVGAPARSSAYIPEGEFGRTEYTADCLLQNRTRYILGGLIPLPRGYSLLYSIHRAPGFDDFDDKELAALRVVFPDVGRAIHGALLAERIEELKREEGLKEEAGWLLLDREGEVLYGDAGGLSLVARLRVPGAHPGDFLVEAVRTLETRAEGSTVEATLAVADEGWAKVTLTRTDRGIVCLLERLRGQTSTFLAEANRARLTPRELQIARLAIQGRGNKEIGYELKLSPITVKLHLRSIYRKTHTTNRSELTARLLGGTIGHGDREAPTMGVSGPPRA